MKIEKYVTNPMTSLHLAAAGVRLKSIYGFVKSETAKTVTFRLVPSGDKMLRSGFLHAYTLGELGEMIPFGHLQSATVEKMPGGVWQVKSKNGKMHFFKNETEARAHVLLDLLNSKTITIDQVNKPDRFNEPYINPKNILPR